MGRLILLLLVALGVGMYFPSSRKVLLAKGEPVLRPILEWNATREMNQIATGLQTMEEDEHRLPDRREWVKWLGSTFTADVARDPWGSVYNLEIQEDSFAIVSNGSDRMAKTEDDVRDARLRNWKSKPSGGR